MQHHRNNFKETEKKQRSSCFARCHSLFAFCSLLLAACTLSPPHAPRWDTTVSLPIINKRYTIQELIKEGSDLYTDSNGLVHFVSESKIDPFRVGDRLKINAFSKAYDTKLGLFTVPAPGSVNAQIALRDCYPNAVTLAGQTVPIPAFSFSLPPIALTPYANFGFVEIAKGTLSLELRNDLPVPIGNPLRLEIHNGVQGATIVAFDINEVIQPGQTIRRAVDFAGKNFGNKLALVMSGYSPGSGGKLIPRLDPDSKITITLKFSELQVSRASAKIGQQVISDVGEAAVGDSMNVDLADIKSGQIAFAIQNSFPVSAWLVITLADFYKANNNTFTDSILVIAKGSTTKNIDLTGFSFRPLATAFGQQKLRLHWRFRTTNNPNEFVTFSSGDDLKGTFAGSDIIFAKVQGRFNAKTITLAPQNFKIDLPEGLDSLRLGEVGLRVTLGNGVNFPMRADLQIDGVSNDGRAVQMLVRGDLKAGQANGTPVESVLLLDKSNSNIIKFFNALPKSINVHGKVTFGEPAYLGLVRHTDIVTGVIKFDAALAFSLPAQKVESDVAVLNIDKSTRNRLKDNLHRGKVMMRLNNHLPVGATIALNLALDQAKVFSAPDLSIGPFSVLAPDINATTGRVVQAKSNTVEIGLDEKQLQLFQQAPLYTGVLIDFPGTKGQLVRLVAEDYIDIQAVAEINFAVSEDKSK